MQNSKIFAAIDIGTTKVFTVIGMKSDEGRINIIGHGTASCSGVRKGVIEDVAATQSAVRASVANAERASGTQVDTAFVGISGRTISYEKRFDTIDWVGEHGVITQKELEQIPVSVVGRRTNGSRHGRHVIHAIPRSYSIDGKQGLSDPMGMHTSTVDVETHLVQGSEIEISKLKSALEGAGIKIESLVLNALASSESVLMQEEKVRGAAMVDIGGGTTDVLVYKNGTMQYSSVIPVGGFQFTNDITVVYNSTFEAAEAVKLNQANVLPSSATIHEEVTLPVSNGRTSLDVSLHDICQLTRERAHELTRMITLKLREGGVSDPAGFPVILSGGGANLQGFLELFRSNTFARVRLGAPLGYLGVPRELQKPIYSTGVGILVWAAYQDDDEPKPRDIGEPYISHSPRHAPNGNGNNHEENEEPKKARRRGIMSMFRR